MAKSIHDILGYAPLTQMVRTVKTGVPDILPAGFKTIAKEVPGDKSQWIQRTGTRRTAKRVEYGADARRAELREVSARDAVMVHSFEVIELPLLTWQVLRQMDSYQMQDLAQQEVDEQLTQFAARQDNLELTMILQVLANGVLYFDADGNLLPTSSGATVTVTFGVPAGNQGQGNIDGSGAVIAASWATTSTDIALHLRNFRIKALQAHGYEPQLAIYGKNIPTYFQNNTTLNPYFQRHEGFRERLVTSNEIPNGMLDFNWVPGWKAFYEDSGGTNRSILGDDTIIFCPEPSVDWYQLQKGSYLIPRTLDIASSTGVTDLRNFQTVHGRFAFAKLKHTPVKAEAYGGNTCLPLLKNPNVVYQFDVTP